MYDGSQRRFSTSAAVFMATLMALTGISTLLFFSTPSKGAVIRTIIEKGDITVTGDEYYSNEVWRVSGDISVESGGKLTLENMTIYMNCSTDGEYGIYVYSGGELIIKNSTITTTNTTALIEQPSGTVWNKTWGYHWKFYIYSGASATLLNSTFSYLWGDNGNHLSTSAGGVVILSSDVYMYNCTVEKAEQNLLFIGSLSGINPITPKIYNCRLINSTAWGIMIAAGAEPTIVGNLISDAPYRGIQIFYYGDPDIRNNVIQNCGSTRDLKPSMQDPLQTAGLVIDFIYYSGRPAPVYENNTFINNTNGIGLRRFSSGTCQIILRNNTITRNRYYGIMTGPYSSSSYSVVDALIVNNTISYNGWDGIYLGKYSNFVGRHTNAIAGNRIYGNGKNGILIGNETSGVSVNIHNNSIYENGMYGIECIGGIGTYSFNDLHDNTLGGIHVVSGTPTVFNNTIDASGTDMVGVLIERIAPSLYNNTITGGGVGTLMKYRRVNRLSPLKNELTGGAVGIEFEECDHVSFKTNITVRNSYTGVLFKKCNYVGINEHLQILGANTALEFNSTVGVKISGATISAVRNGMVLTSGSHVSLQNSSFGSVGVYYAVLDDNSTLLVKNTTLPLNRISVGDTLSTVEVYWPVFINVEDEGGYPLEDVEVRIENSAGEVVKYHTPADGKLSWIWLEEFYYMNGTSTVLNPYNISVSLEEYIPQWGNHTINRLTTLHYTLEFNYPPGVVKRLQPLQTHNITPTLTWEPGVDPNGDTLHYYVEVYEDIVSDATFFYSKETWEPRLFVERPMKYHHSYYVKITAFDPWGKFSEKTFKVSVVNTPPGKPGISVTPNPASTVEDLTVSVVRPSEDADTNPVDTITYVYTWYVNGVPVQEGESATLSHHYTKEGDVVSVKVTPFDGIDYGTPATLDVHIVNFAPVALVDEINLTTEEDTPLENALNLNDYFADRDLDVLTFAVKEERHITAEIDSITGNITIYPEKDWNGVDYIIVEASDGRARAQANPSLKIVVKVTSVNDPPAILSVNSIPVSEEGVVVINSLQDSKLVLVPSASDPDIVYGDTLSFSTDAESVITSRGVSITDDGLKYSFDPNTGTISFTLLNSLVGVLRISLTVTDSHEISSTITMVLKVRNLNDPPTTPKILTPSQGERLSGLTVNFKGEASDDPDLHIPNSTEHITYIWDFGDGERTEGEDLNVTHTYDVPGTYNVYLTAVDSQGLSSSTNITITVTGEISPAEFKQEKHEKTFLEKYYGWIIALIVLIIVAVGILIFVKSREPLEGMVEVEEKDLERLKSAVAPALPAPGHPPEEAPPAPEQPPAAPPEGEAEVAPPGETAPPAEEAPREMPPAETTPPGAAPPEEAAPVPPVEGAPAPPEGETPPEVGVQPQETEASEIPEGQGSPQV